MKKNSWISGIFIMTLCIAFGILFPRFVFSKSLSKSLKQVEEYEIEPVDIGHSNTVIHAMRSCSNSEYSFDYQEEMAELSREQLIKICNSFLTELKLSEWGYHNIVVNESNMKATCHLEVMNNEEKYRIKTTKAASDSVSSYEEESLSTDKERNTAISTVIWNIEVEYSPNCVIMIKVDDKNQKVVQIIDYARKYSKDGDVAYTELAYIEPYVSEIVIPFFKKYYDADVEMMECDYWNCIIQMVDNNNEEILLSLQVSDGLLEMTTYE